jgi:hypothetical protein
MAYAVLKHCVPLSRDRLEVAISTPPMCSRN